MLSKCSALLSVLITRLVSAAEITKTATHDSTSNSASLDFRLFIKYLTDSCELVMREGIMIIDNKLLLLLARPLV